LNVRSCVAGACTYLQQILFSEVLQLCSHPVIGWPDAPPGLFGLRSIQVAAIRAGSHPPGGGLVFALFTLLS
jgi:hypothetical protein